MEQFKLKLQIPGNFLVLMLLITAATSQFDFDLDDEEKHMIEENVTLSANEFEPRLTTNSSENNDLTFPGCGLRFTEVRRRKRQIEQLFFNQNETDIIYQRLKRQMGPHALPIIIGGIESKPHSWPWMVAIFRVVEDRLICGGSLISKKYVLTAAHCFTDRKDRQNPSTFKIIVGSHTTKEGTDYSIEEIIVHPDYLNSQFYKDIALMKVKGEVKLTKEVYPVCLPSPRLKHKVKTGTFDVTVIGWGRLEAKKDGTFSEKLQEVKLPIVPHRKCRSSFSEISSRKIPKGIVPQQICAGYKEGEKDACQGDSGGPMTMELKDKSWVQLGIVSFGYGCAKPGFPGVHTRISNYIQWLYENTDLGKKY